MMLLCVSAGDTVGDHGVRPGVEGDNDDVIVCVCQQVILSGIMALDPAWRETMMMLLCVSAGDTVGDRGVRSGVEGDNDDVIVCVSR